MRSCVFLLLAASAGVVSAQVADYPSRPVTVIVPTAPGGPVDFEARLHTGKLSGFLGQPFVLDYKAGAGTTLAAGFVAKAKPDGYTLSVFGGSFTIFPALYKNLAFDTLKDIVPISLMSKRTTVLLAHPAFRPTTFSQYLEYAKANPGKINYGTLEPGSGSHLAGAWLHSASNTKATFVPYKGAGPAMTDLVAGRIDVMSTALITAMPLVKAGKVRILAIMNQERSTVLPALATISEQGVPGYNYSAWFGFGAPAGIPAALVDKLHQGLVKVAKSQDVIATLEADGGIVLGSTPAEFRNLIASETALWKKIVQDNGIKLEE